MYSSYHPVMWYSSIRVYEQILRCEAGVSLALYVRYLPGTKLVSYQTIRASHHIRGVQDCACQQNIKQKHIIDNSTEYFYQVTKYFRVYYHVIRAYIIHRIFFGGKTIYINGDSDKYTRCTPE